MSSASLSRTEVAQRLRAVLLDPEEAAGLDVIGRIDAAVLVPLYLRDGDLHAVFTRRRDDMRRHPGEISFPGGRQDEDEFDLRDTALRESEEEIGLHPDEVELIGALQPTPTIATNYAVYPFVGLIEPGHEWQPSANEVAEVMEVPLRALRADELDRARREADLLLGLAQGGQAEVGLVVVLAPAGERDLAGVAA